MKTALVGTCEDQHKFYYEAGGVKACPICLMAEIGSLQELSVSMVAKVKGKNEEIIDAGPSDFDEILKTNATGMSLKGFFVFRNFDQKCLEIWRGNKDFTEIKKFGGDYFQWGELEEAKDRIRQLENNHSIE